jgi:hypothetical protein
VKKSPLAKNVAKRASSRRRRRNKKQRRKWIDTHFGTAVMAKKHLGVAVSTLKKYIDDGRMTPDASTKGKRVRHYFRQDRLQEHIAAWNARHEKSPNWVPARVIITPHGMIRPRAEPKAEAFARLILSLPKADLPLSSLKKKAATGQKKLVSQPCGLPLRHIWSSTSKRGLLTRTARGMRVDT